MGARDALWPVGFALLWPLLALFLWGRVFHDLASRVGTEIVLATTVLPGIAAIALAHWPWRAKAVVGGFYAALLFGFAPWIVIMAACAADECE